MSMDYFRRPLLSGKGVPRVPFATIRGSIRRHDADGSSAVPYFTGVSAAQTLLITANGTPYVVVLSGATLAGTIADINAILTTHGTAFDAFGSLGISSGVLGAIGAISVTGGTAAFNLGFDVSDGPIASTGGDVPSTPESGVGNIFGTAFPAKSENLNAETVQRGMSRLAANADVLYADLSRGDAVRLKTPFTPSGDGKYVTIATGTKIFTGGPAASNPNAPFTRLSSKPQLAPFFMMIDTVTGLPAASQIVAAVNGVPVGEPPYADTASSSANDGGNVLGLDLLRVTALAITSISPDGRTINASGGAFIVAGVVPGDYVEIASATNTTLSNNNGVRWVVDAVNSATQIVVRPMSKGELTSMGSAPVDTQPVVELASDITGGQSFGTLNVHTGNGFTGTAASALNLVVRPPIPPGATYELWVSQPHASRISSPWERAYGDSLGGRNDVGVYADAPNGLLTNPTFSLGGGNYQVGTFFVRWNGQVISVPAVNITRLGGGTVYVYWNELTCAVVASTTAPSFKGSTIPSPVTVTGNGALIARVDEPGGTIHSSGLVFGTAKTSITVGHGGDFQTIQEAAEFVNAIILTGGDSQAEIVLLNNITISSSVTFVGNHSISIRGVNPLTTITMNTASPIFVAGGNFRLADLSISVGGPARDVGVLVSSISFASVVLDNVTESVGSPFAPLAWVTVDHTVSDNVTVEIRHCTLQVKFMLIGGIGNGSFITLLNSSFDSIGVGANICQFLSSSAAGGSLTKCNRLKVLLDKCSFTHVRSNDATGIAVLLSADTSNISLLNCQFLSCSGNQFGAGIPNSLMISTNPTVPTLLLNVYMDSTFNLLQNLFVTGGVASKFQLKNCVISTVALQSGSGASVHASGCTFNSTVSVPAIASQELAYNDCIFNSTLDDGAVVGGSPYFLTGCKIVGVTTLANTGWVINGCQFIAAASFTGSYVAGSTFAAAATGIASTITGCNFAAAMTVSGSILSGNIIRGTTVSAEGASFVGNTFTNTCTVTTGAVGTWGVSFFYESNNGPGVTVQIDASITDVFVSHNNMTALQTDGSNLVCIGNELSSSITNLTGAPGAAGTWTINSNTTLKIDVPNSTCGSLLLSCNRILSDTMTLKASGLLSVSNNLFSGVGPTTLALAAGDVLLFKDNQIIAANGVAITLDATGMSDIDFAGNSSLNGYVAITNLTGFFKMRGNRISGSFLGGNSFISVAATAASAKVTINDNQFSNGDAGLSADSISVSGVSGLTILGNIIEKGSGSIGNYVGASGGNQTLLDSNLFYKGGVIGGTAVHQGDRAYTGAGAYSLA